MKAKASLLITQANSPLTAKIFKILLMLSQMKFWYPTSPVKFIQALKKPHLSFTVLEHIIFMLKYYNIEFNSSWVFTVKGGSTPIVDYLINTPKLLTHINSLRKKNTFYLDQITQPDGVFLKSWQEIKRILTSKKGRTPSWYKYISETITTNPHNLRLSSPLDLINPTPILGKRPRSISNINNPIVKGNNKWVAFWDPSSKMIIIGRIIEKNFTNRTRATIYIKHLIPTIPSILRDNSSTSRSTIQALTKYQGCKLHSPYFTGSFSYICIINKLLESVFVIRIMTTPDGRKFNFETPQTTSSNKKTFFLTLPLQTLSAQALLDFNTRTNQHSILPNSTHMVHVPLITVPPQAWGLGWLITNHPMMDAAQLSFHCKANKFPSSTRAESLALVSALATCSPNSSIMINTDLKCIIDTFTYLSRNPPTQRFLKCNNYLIWSAIFKIIKSHHLTVTLIKVKAHLDDHYNNEADALAN
ncbi:ribonuclease H-like domain-containing protein [Rhizophagus clarus]|uniref:Ribonuclease H-like domain-containing protein n=1 Tax=Rhizophagus clarus TaxID=94130 RepID=A0A8H3M7D8_9GLOM|nr:ribonuclease H-like domain-containing protein [Rhizophagus clarus]